MKLKKFIKNALNMEIEVFVRGACIAYSGGVCYLQLFNPRRQSEVYQCCRYRIQSYDTKPPMMLAMSSYYGQL